MLYSGNTKQITKPELWCHKTEFLCYIVEIQNKSLRQNYGVIKQNSYVI